jgi:hypothetical protein
MNLKKIIHRADSGMFVITEISDWLYYTYYTEGAIQYRV